MKTKLFTLLFALLSANGVFALMYEQIGDLFYILDGATKTATVTAENEDADRYTASYSSLPDVVVVPSVVTCYNVQYDVTSIDGFAFRNCTGLTSITIPESVTYIGWEAFCGCTGLTSITIPKSVTDIGEYAFCGCTGLTSITIPENVTSIGVWALDDCTGLTSIIWNARNCTIINDLSNTYELFDNDTPQIVSLTIGENVETIPDHLCLRMSGLTSIVWNARNCTLNNNWWLRFSYNSTYDSFLSSQITSFTIGSNVEYLPEYLCDRMSKLTSITIPESVTHIGVILSVIVRD